MTIEVRIDADTCMGSGNCAFWAPKAFDISDSGIAVVLDPEAEAEDRILAAAAGCPTRSISVSRDGEPAS